MGWFWAFLLVGSVAYVESGAPTFSSNAVEHIRADFKTVRRTRKDFTRIEITAQPGRMVEEPNDIDTNRVTVETKAGNLEFSPVLVKTLTLGIQAGAIGLWWKTNQVCEEVGKKYSKYANLQNFREIINFSLSHCYHAGRYKWTVTDVAPCVQHAFRLWLHGKVSLGPGKIVASTSTCLSGWRTGSV